MVEGMNPTQTSRRRRQGWLLAGLTAASMLLHFLVTDQVGRTLPTTEDANEIEDQANGSDLRQGGQADPFRLSASHARTGPSSARRIRQNQKRKVPPRQEGPTRGGQVCRCRGSGIGRASATDPAASAPKSGRSPGTRFHAKQPGEGPTFEWPKATKVSFKLDGYFRGPITGTSAVEWLRQDNRYQVHMDIQVGGGLFSVQATSEGEITRWPLPRAMKPRGAACSLTPLCDPLFSIATKSHLRTATSRLAPRRSGSDQQHHPVGISVHSGSEPSEAWQLDSCEGGDRQTVGGRCAGHRE